MIGYRISLAQLRAAINAEDPHWLADAQVRTARLQARGSYAEKTSNWSKVKPVYMRLQGESKCAFCERKLESTAYGRGEQDVEHFRPKRKTSRWPVPRSLQSLGVTCTDPGQKRPGYHLLAYSLFNYCASCKPCNSALKRNYFPIAGVYDHGGADPIALLAELPYLIYPLGDFEERPEDLIEFQGIIASPVASGGFRRDRARVTIQFFQLNSRRRKNLLLERARVIGALFPQLEVLSHRVQGLPLKVAGEVVDSYTSPKALHTNCARSFVRLYQSDRDQAARLHEKAHRLIKRSS
jgi:hypothetical protein